MKLNKTAVELLLARNQMTVKEMASNAGISERTYYTGCNKNILPVKVGALAKALGVDPEEIIVKE